MRFEAAPVLGKGKLLAVLVNLPHGLFTHRLPTGFRCNQLRINVLFTQLQIQTKLTWLINPEAMLRKPWVLRGSVLLVKLLCQGRHNRIVVNKVTGVGEQICVILLNETRGELSLAKLF